MYRLILGGERDGPITARIALFCLVFCHVHSILHQDAQCTPSKFAFFSSK